ncbi:MAG: hypothetical protein J6A99_00445, partial [Clostridia bacterium]|nr:hypothetical protein [Clostridia bacterium]
MNKSKIFKIMLMLLCAIMALCIVACSEREQTDDEGGGPDNKPIDGGGIEDIITDRKTAFSYIADSMSYLDNGIYVDPDWLCINTTIAFDYHAYEELGDSYSNVPKKRANYNLSVMMNINLHDNSQSVALIELNNVYQGATYLGLYYYDSTLYLNVAGNKYYAEQINLTTIGNFIVDKMMLGTNDPDKTDIVDIIGKALQSEIDIGDFSGVIKIAWGILFEKENIISYSNNKKYT